MVPALHLAFSAFCNFLSVRRLPQSRNQGCLPDSEFKELPKCPGKMPCGTTVAALIEQATQSYAKDLSRRLLERQQLTHLLENLHLFSRVSALHQSDVQVHADHREGTNASSQERRLPEFDHLVLYYCCFLQTVRFCLRHDLLAPSTKKRRGGRRFCHCRRRTRRRNYPLKMRRSRPQRLGRSPTTQPLPQAGTTRRTT